ncbi:Aldose_reductase [Hexamita inflata]|uniref:Aldose_reductase n=1 Tax=Hexamita inflata TaxID=28002 RepID=A0ABP1HRG9_9EUKA
MNEKDVGIAIRKAINDGLVTREQLFITTKLWNTYHNPAFAEIQLKASLKNLQLEYIDLFVIHWPISFDQITETGQKANVEDDLSEIQLYPRKEGKIMKQNISLEATWCVMESFVERGFAKNIGVSNYTVALMNDLLSYCKIKPFCNQIESHLYFQNTVLIDFCNEHEVRVVAYSPFGGKYDYGRNAGRSLFQDEVLTKIASKYSCSVTDIMMTFHSSRVWMVIPKSSQYKNLQNNIEFKCIQMDQQDLKQLMELNKADGRFNDAGRVFWETPVFD